MEERNMTDILFTGLAGSSIATGTNTVRTAGYSQAGLGAATYVYDAAVDSTYVAAHPRAAFLAADGRGLRLHEAIWDFEMFGAIPDDSTDCYSAWTAMKAYALANALTDSRYAFDYHAYAPAPVRLNGRYYSSQTWQVHLSWTFFSEVDGNGLTGGSHSARLRFAADQHGVILNNERTIGDQVYVADSQMSAAGTALRGLAILGSGTDTSKHGVWARTRFVIENCSIDGFPGNNINVVGTGTATTLGTNTQYGNCNTSLVNGLGLSNSGRHGFFADGADVNACSFTGINVLTAGAAGIFDSSFLGNTYMGCAVHGCGSANLGRVTHGGNIYSLISETLDVGKNTTPGTNNLIWYDEGVGVGPSAWSNTIDYVPSGAFLSSSANNRSLILNPYIEIGCPIAHADVPARVIAPNIYASWTHYSAYDFVNSGYSGCIASPRGFSSYMGLDGDLAGTPYGAFHAASLGGNLEPGLLLKGESGLLSTFRLFQYPSYVAVSWDNLDVSKTVLFHGPQTTATFGRTNTQPYAAAFNKFVLGDRHLGVVSAVSDLNGTDVAQGEIYFNRGATAGGKVGWVVTTGGTVGSGAVLKPFGTIDA
jgi:hypothetical protein